MGRVPGQGARDLRGGQEIAASRGLVLVDTKFEFGLADDGTCVLIDEVLTPDSSRYWLAHSYEARHAAGQAREHRQGVPAAVVPRALRPL